jgi:putative spermidine/putrescine transport system substrate-binding protein
VASSERAERIAVLSWKGGWGQALREAVSDPFERETGIRVEHVPHVGLKLPPALGDALDRDERPPVDVVWCNSVPALLARRAGRCEPLDPERSPVLRELRDRAFPEAAAGPDRSSPSVVHPYVVYYVLAYHEQAVESEPRSWQVLLDPRHRGKIALYPGGNGFYPIAQKLGGGSLADFPDALEPCWSFVRKLREQVGELDYSIGMEERLRTRQLDLCFRALTNALAFRAAGLPIAWCIPQEGTTDTVDALWIPRGVPSAEREAAERYIAFALRADIQERWCSALGAMPVHPGAQIPALLRDRSDVPAHADDHRGILHVPEHLKVTHEARWEARFQSLLAQT